MKMMVQQNVFIFMQVLQDDFYGIRAIESHVDGTVVEFKVTVVELVFRFFTVVSRWWCLIFLAEAMVVVILTTVQISSTEQADQRKMPLNELVYHHSHRGFTGRCRCRPLLLIIIVHSFKVRRIWFTPLVKWFIC